MSLEDCQVEVGITLMSRATLWPQTRLGPWAVKAPIFRGNCNTWHAPELSAGWPSPYARSSCNINLRRSDISFQQCAMQADKGWPELSIRQLY